MCKEKKAAGAATNNSHAGNSTRPARSGQVLISPRDTAAMLGISEATLYRMRQSGRLPLVPVKFSAGCTRYNQTELLRWIDAGCPVSFKGGVR